MRHLICYSGKIVQPSSVSKHETTLWFSMTSIHFCFTVLHENRFDESVVAMELVLLAYFTIVHL